MARLFRLQAHHQEQQRIVIDLPLTYGQSVPCLEMPVGQDNYAACLAIFPGSVLAQIYCDHGPRLLERNVRAFLQATGGVNKGIRETIRNEPGRFLAYNNGISATASRVEYVTRSDGQRAIGIIHDFQIVNGGQTTASLHRAMVKDRVDLAQVQVQAKITIVDHDRMTEMVPLISRYANRQNKIEEADLAANEEFHVRLQRMSQRHYTPALPQTLWFYERARGQYKDEESRATTPAKRKKFRELSPPRQKFTKTDVAKFVLTWEQLPQIVSRGNQKNFAYFSVWMAERGGIAVDAIVFQRLVALNILFQATKKLVQHFPAYRANIMTYSLAWLSHATSKQLDLNRIWKDQEVLEELRNLLSQIVNEVRGIIVTAPAGANVTEWCKRDLARDQILNTDVLSKKRIEPFMVEEAFEFPISTPAQAEDLVVGQLVDSDDRL
jgi:hypothetical protein